MEKGFCGILSMLAVFYHFNDRFICTVTRERESSGGGWARTLMLARVAHSCFSSDRINLSPFTKDFRGEEQQEF